MATVFVGGGGGGDARVYCVTVGMWVTVNGDPSFNVGGSPPCSVGSTTNVPHIDIIYEVVDMPHVVCMCLYGRTAWISSSCG